MAAPSCAFVGGETAGAPFVLWKTAMGPRINGGVGGSQTVTGLEVGRATDGEDLWP